MRAPPHGPPPATWRRGAPLRRPKRSPGRLRASCGAGEPTLIRPQHGCSCAFNQVAMTTRALPDQTRALPDQTRALHNQTRALPDQTRALHNQTRALSTRRGRAKVVRVELHPRTQGPRGASRSNTARFPIKHGRFPIKKGRFPIKLGRFLIKHERFLIKHRRFPIQHGHFLITHGRFPINKGA